MSRGPIPSQLCLLSQLPAYAVHDKVRFLGWYVQTNDPVRIVSPPICSETDY